MIVTSMYTQRSMKELLLGELLLIFLIGFSHLVIHTNGFQLDTWTLINPLTNRVIGQAGPADPKDVFLIHYKAGLIPYPLVGYGDITLHNVSTQSWLFCTNFTLNDLLAAPGSNLLTSNLTLTLHGVDTIGQIFLNGHLLGKTFNMFYPYEYSIGHEVLQPGTGINQTLEILISSATKYSLAQAASYKSQYGYSVPPNCPVPSYRGECHYNFIRKMAASYSWDWGPAFPGAAIWLPVELKAWSGCRFGNLTVLPVLKGVNLFSPADWSLIVEFDAECSSGYMKNIQIAAKIPELGSTLVKTIPVKKVHDSYKVEWGPLSSSFNLSLWWPNEYGEQSLYTLNAELTTDSFQDVLPSELSKAFGFRTVKLVQTPVTGEDNLDAGLTYYFEINSIPVFLKGSNWIPNTVFPANASCDRYQYMFQTMDQSHFNAIRVWGGGHYELDCFYDLADKYGILVWEDFMFACSLYPTDPKFMAEVATEAEFQIKRLKTHPSIIVWAGNNENEVFLATGAFHLDANYSVYKKDYLQLYNATLHRIATHNDVTRPFVLSSPSNGAETEAEGGLAKKPYSEYYGDVHFYNYNSDGWSVGTYPIPRCASEYGFQSLPNIETMLEELNLTDLSYWGDAIEHRQHHPDGQLQIYDEIGMNLPLPKNCTDTNGVRTNNGGGESKASLCDIYYYAEMTYLSQINQAMSIRTQTEHYRRGMGNYMADGRGGTMCAMYWQLNDIWAAPTWAGVDHAGRWKMLQYYAKNFFAPLLPSVYLAEDGKVYGYVVSDLLEPVTDVTFRVTVLEWGSFVPIFTTDVYLQSVAPLKSRMVYKSKNISSSTAWQNGQRHHGKLHSSSGILFTARMFQGETPLSAESVIYLDKLTKMDPVHYGTANVVSITKNLDKPGYQLALTSDKPVPFLWIDCIVTDGVFSDNGFTMTVDRLTLEFVPWDRDFSGDLTINDFTMICLGKK